MRKKIFCSALVFLFCLPIFNLYACKSNDVKITSYNISVSLQDNIISGKETVCFYNDTENSFSVLKFNLYANAFKKDAKYSPIAFGHLSQAYYKGLNYGEISIKSVYQGQNPLEYEITGIDQNILSVKLINEVFPDESVSVTIDFEMVVPYIIARTGINENTINLANFYPILCGIQDNAFYECVYYSNGDPYFSDVANYTVEFSYDEEYVVASSGKVIKNHNENGRSKTTYKIDKARSFCFVLSKDFEILTDSSLGVEINYYYYDDENASKSLQTAIDCIKLFNEKFGAFPYSHYAICQTKFIAGGMEFPALVYISDSLDDKAYKEVIVHETAHQWWQTGVGNNEIEFSFLDEGLAEYSVVVFYENYPEYGFTRKQLIELSEKSFKSYCSVYDKLFGSIDTSMIKNLGSFTSEYEYINIAYIKPCIMYDYLRETIGDKKFFSALKNYYNDYCFKNATPIELVGAFEKTGAKCEGFLTSFFDGKEII